MAQGTTILDEIRKHSAWSIFMGVLTAALGILLIVYPFATGILTTAVVGTTLIVTGVVGIILALSSHTAGSFFVHVLLAALYGLAGIVLLVFPLQGVASLTLVLGAMLVVRGIFAAVTAIRVRPVDGWGWLLADGLFGAAAGVLVLLNWPASSAWAVGTLVGAAVLMTGISRSVLASRIHGGVDRLSPHAA